jgi:uncharacterized membrane protein YhaH (DUF805 family)
MEWAALPLKRYADFAGRARRKEYWWFVLLYVVAFVLASLVDLMAGLRGMIGPYGPLTAVVLLALLVPSVAVGVRRLHDIDRSGWWLLAAYAPLILSMLLPLAGIVQPTLALILLVVAGAGFILLLVFSVLEGTKGPNRYGPDPKGAEAAAPGAA